MRDRHVGEVNIQTNMVWDGVRWITMDEFWSLCRIWTGNEWVTREEWISIREYIALNEVPAPGNVPEEPGGIVVDGLHVPESGLHGVREMKWGAPRVKENKEER